MKQKLAPIPLDLYPTKEPYKPSYSELMAELEADKKRAQTEKEKKKASYHPDLHRGFGIFLCLLGLLSLIGSVILIFMIVFVIFIAYAKNLTLKVVSGFKLGPYCNTQANQRIQVDFDNRKIAVSQTNQAKTAKQF